MEITIKTLKGDVFKVQCDENTETVSSLKSKISELKNFPIENQKLIFSGTILSNDESTLKSAGVSAGSFVVCMVSKKKKKKKKKKIVEPAPTATPTPATTTPVSTTTSTPAPTTDDKMEVDSTPAPTTTDADRTVPDAPTKTSEQTTPTTTPVSTTTSSTPAVTSEALNQLKAMGFPESEARVALRAAFNNPMRAVEYLTSGIPPHLASMAAQNTSTTPAPTTSSTTTPPATATTTSSSSDPLAVLRTDPAFQEMKRMVQSDPTKLTQIMAQIGQRQPELFRLINENKQEFLRMLNEPVSSTPSSSTPSTATTPPTIPGGMGGGGLPGMMSPEMISQYLQNMPAAQRNQLMQSLNITPEQLSQISQAMSRMPPQVLQQLLSRGPQGMGMPGMPGMPGTTPGQQLPPGAHVVRLSQEEAAAVQRLQGLGFSRQQAIEAYLACDKNEQMAANLLFDGSFQ